MQLNGAGIRTKWFFKIYVGALYLPEKQTSAEAIIADDRERRVVMYILHELGSEKLFNAFNEAIEANHIASGDGGDGRADQANEADIRFGE